MSGPGWVGLQPPGRGRSGRSLVEWGSWVAYAGGTSGNQSRGHVGVARMGLNFLVSCGESFYIFGVGRKWRIIIAAAVVALVIGGITWPRSAPREPEPVYQEQPRSAWIN